MLHVRASGARRRASPRRRVRQGPRQRCQELVFRTRDLSEHGVFLYTKVARAYPFKVGSTLQLELYDYDQHVTCKVVVVRIVEPGSSEAETFPTGFGVRIVELTDPARAQIASMIARVKSGEVY